VQILILSIRLILLSYFLVFASGEDFSVVQKDVAQLIKKRILVGHALEHDMKVLFLSHPRTMIRDTSK
jgi:DNA polymerase III epsilon subunit-like protein